MRISVVIVALCLQTLQAATAQERLVVPDDSIRAVARWSLGAFLDKIPQGFESRYGFNNRKEFSRAEVGVPVRVYRADTDNPSDHPLPENEWRVPVLVDGEHRALLTVTAENGVLSVVDLGAAVLAREFGDYHRKYPGKSRALLRLHALKCDMMIIGRPGAAVDDGDYYPLHSARAWFAADGSRPRSRKTTFTEIRTLYRQLPATRPPQE